MLQDRYILWTIKIVSCYLFIHVWGVPYNGLTLLVGWQEGHLACKKTEWWGVGVITCLKQGAHLHMAQLMPLPLTVSCFSKIQIGFAFLVPAHPGSPGQRAVKRVCVCVIHVWGAWLADQQIYLCYHTFQLKCNTQITWKNKNSHGCCTVWLSTFLTSRLFLRIHTHTPV